MSSKERDRTKEEPTRTSVATLREIVNTSVMKDSAVTTTQRHNNTVDRVTRDIKLAIKARAANELPNIIGERNLKVLTRWIEEL